MLRIGEISFANCTPIFYALKKYHDCSGYKFITGVPSHLNRLLRIGRIDVSPSSSIEYFKHSDKYIYLPELSISSIGPAKSILLFSGLPLEELDGRTIAVTYQAATSEILLKIILKEFLSFRNSFVRTTKGIKDALKGHVAYLSIGDEALKFFLKSDTKQGPLFIYDLGELWYKYTHLPFVFALWIARKDSYESGKDLMDRLLRDLQSSKEIAYREYEQIADDAQEREWIQRESLIEYWRTISYDLTGEHLKGLDLFFNHAKRFFPPLADLREHPKKSKDFLGTLLRRRKS